MSPVMNSLRRIADPLIDGTMADDLPVESNYDSIDDGWG
jgi:hypothetical protein